MISYFYFRANIEDAPKCEEYNMKIRVWVNPQKDSIHSAEGAIGKNHHFVGIISTGALNLL